MRKRALTMLGASFGALLLAGVTFAQVGVFSPSADEEEPATPLHQELPTMSDEPREGLPGEDPAPTEDQDAPESEPAPKPAEEPAQEPKEDPIEEEVSEEDASELWLEILAPDQEQVVHEKTVAFEGHVSAGTRVFRGKFEADLEYLPEKGFATWRLVLVLSSGENLVTFEAVNADGESTTASVLVIYQPLEYPKDEPKDEAGKYDWTAYQKYGECGESPPYDVFYGTGAPGTEVWVESAYGSGMTTVGDYGKWDLKVIFEEAPCGEEFKVVIETSEGDRSEFWFVRICEDGGDK